MIKRKSKRKLSDNATRWPRLRNSKRKKPRKKETRKPLGGKNKRKKPKDRAMRRPLKKQLLLRSNSCKKKLGKLNLQLSRKSWTMKSLKHRQRLLKQKL